MRIGGPATLIRVNEGRLFDRFLVFSASKTEAGVPALRIGRDSEGGVDERVEHEKPAEVSSGTAAPPSSFIGDVRALLADAGTGPDRRKLPLLAFGIVAVLVLNMVGQVALNTWNGAFFDSLEARDLGRFLPLFGLFFVIVGLLLVAVVAQTWFQELFKIRFRAGLSRALMDRWLAPGRAYRLPFMGEQGSAPDQRMQEDTRLCSELTTELSVGILQSAMLLVTFVAVLWKLSPDLRFDLFGIRVVIPAYMVWIAVGYAGIGSGLTWLVGRRLIPLNTARYAREADLRFALVRVNENAEGVALYGGEPDERRSLDLVLETVLRATRKVSAALSQLTWITSGYGWVAMVVPIIAAAPAFFLGSMSFGELMMVVGAFHQVQTSLRWFVDNFPRIADWRSAVHRVSMFRDALAAVDEDTTADRIALEPHPEGLLAFEHVAIALIDGSIVVEEADAEIRTGERVLLEGPSGSGKSTIFRVVAGLWPWGSGRVLLPPAERQMFMPQRPYLPLGTLRAAVCYPASADAFPSDAVETALRRVGLGEFEEALDRDERWDKSLSLGQQQRIAFARLLLHRPDWVFMDEATSALDDDNQAAMLRLFDEDLKTATVLSIAHRAGLESFHTRTIRLVKTSSGSKLFGPVRRHGNKSAGWKRLFRAR